MAAAAPLLHPRPRLAADSDERLLARLRAGDDAAFEALYRRHHRPLLAFCQHMLDDRQEAEDALQHVFLALHRRVHDQRSLRVQPWLYTVARNRCLSVLRARRETLPLEPDAAPPAAGTAVAEEVERREDVRDLLADVHALPTDQRAALLLSELADLPHADVASVLGVRREKVKALVFQARESLMSSRTAREADCRHVQEELATLHGGALRRASLRKHVKTCPACAAFEAAVRQQRRSLALVLPVVPREGGLAWLGGGAATAAGSGAIATGGGALAGGSTLAGGGTLVAKALVAAGLLAGGAAAVHAHASAAPPHPRVTHPAGVAPAQRAAARPAAASSRRAPAATRPATAAPRHTTAARLTAGASVSAPAHRAPRAHHATPAHAHRAPATPPGRSVRATAPDARAVAAAPPGQAVPPATVHAPQVATPVRAAVRAVRSTARGPAPTHTAGRPAPAAAHRAARAERAPRAARR